MHKNDLSAALSGETPDYIRGYTAAMKEINTPMTVITPKWDPSECPRCHRTYEEFEPCDDGYYDRVTSMERCPYCGQKLSWDGNEI